MKRLTLVAVALTALASGCRTHHTIEMTNKVEPIHITMDINLKIDSDLDRYFGPVDQAAGAATTTTGDTAQ